MKRSKLTSYFSNLRKESAKNARPSQLRLESLEARQLLSVTDVATLAAASDFSIEFTASGNGGTGTSGEIAFTTAGLEPPAATLAATAVSFESESFRVDVSSLGTDSTYADVRMQLSTSEYFTSGVPLP